MKYFTPLGDPTSSAWRLLHYQNFIFSFQIVDHQLWEVIRDPKYMLKTVETRSYWDSEISKYLKMPVWFGYRDGMVQTIQCKQEDPEWSVNMKKGIINMFHLDITGKDEETKLKDMFTKKEVSK